MTRGCGARCRINRSVMSLRTVRGSQEGDGDAVLRCSSTLAGAAVAILRECISNSEGSIEVS